MRESAVSAGGDDASHATGRVTIDGQGFRFLLDTGATTTSIAPRVRSQLGLAVDPAKVSTVMNGTSTLDDIPMVTLDRLAIGEVELREVDATCYRMMPATARSAWTCCRRRSRSSICPIMP